MSTLAKYLSDYIYVSCLICQDFDTLEQEGEYEEDESSSGVSTSPVDLASVIQQVKSKFRVQNAEPAPMPLLSEKVGFFSFVSLPLRC